MQHRRSDKDQESTPNVGEVQNGEKEIKEKEGGLALGKEESTRMTFLGQLQE